MPEQSKPARIAWQAIDGVVLLDKPLGLSSNAALQRARHSYVAQKGGHTGTLDPLASGLLPLCLGEATKFAGALLHADKTYQAEIQLGMTTSTGDSEGDILTQSPVNVELPQLKAALEKFIGPISQVPPMYSALKHQGQPLYRYARNGQQIARVARAVTIHTLELLDWQAEQAQLRLRVACSSGTYIRTLAEDLGQVLGCGAHLSGLRRLAIGALTIDQAISLATLESLTPEARARHLRPVDYFLSHYPVAQLDAEQTRRLQHGMAVDWPASNLAGAAVGAAADAADVVWRLVSPAGQFLGLGQLNAQGQLQPKRLLQIS